MNPAYMYKGIDAMPTHGLHHKGALLALGSAAREVSAGVRPLPVAQAQESQPASAQSLRLCDPAVAQVAEH